MNLECRCRPHGRHSALKASMRAWPRCPDLVARAAVCGHRGSPSFVKASTCRTRGRFKVQIYRFGGRRHSMNYYHVCVCRLITNRVCAFMCVLLCLHFYVCARMRALMCVLSTLDTLRTAVVLLFGVSCQDSDQTMRRFNSITTTVAACGRTWLSASLWFDGLSSKEKGQSSGRHHL